MMPTTFREYARVGARARLEELDRERESILKHFPDLGPSQNETPAESVTKRRRRKMSAAQRKAIGDRMKRYWAAKRAKGTAKK